MVKFRKRITSAKPAIMIAAWPGMGSVAFKAANYLKDAMKAQEIAQLESKELFFPNDAWIDSGLLKMPEAPEGKFYFYKNKSDKEDLIIFIGQAQPSPEKNQQYVGEILEIAKKFKIKQIYTFAAMPAPIDHLKEPEVLAVATDKKLLDGLKKVPVKIMSSGQISGLNGLFLAMARESGFSGTCLLAEIPLYAVQIENPRASLAVLEAFSKLSAIKFDLEQLRSQAKSMQEEIERLIDYLKTPEEELNRPITEEEIEKIKNMLAAQDKLPVSAKNKIEELFSLSKNDIAKASELKQELDKWGIYKEYEDRFLDLFKKKQKKEN
ncbi:MAG: PAC2 family protein [Candidatus Omnitrophica bacterium]|nr:PAC2 family protein [Candidatus Omnitrophota bacterium]HOX54673.1 PAC2 family protein [Candidatus Omnitrophota bacterium]